MFSQASGPATAPRTGSPATSGSTPSRPGTNPTSSPSATCTSPPAPRTAWHAHTIAQTLHVTEGEGLVQPRGEAVTRIRPGDVVTIAGNEWHWHGAAPGHFMTHLPLTEGDTEWGDHVTNAEYNSQETAGSQSSADQLTKLVDLRDRGVISAAEFEREKAKILA